MLTIQILAKNNAKTIRATLESVTHLKARVVVGDLGSTDETKDICSALGAVIVPLGDMPRHEARNRLAREYSDEQNLWLHPWEAVAQWSNLANWKTGCLSVTTFQGSTFASDVRLWKGQRQFVNPVFERLDVEDAPSSSVMLYSRGRVETEEALRWIEWWKQREPLASHPYYYHACLLMAEAKYDEFIKVADHYLFMDKAQTMATTMTRYYYAMAQILHRRAYKPALQNLNLCMCHRPLMAEFWCLTGDVYYHLLNKFEQAIDFYDNAILLGGRRKKEDRWPLEISKYGTYPKKMLQSCKAILEHKGIYVGTTR